MRILMYGWEFPPHISGGLGVACFGLTQALAARGHDITFVLPRLRPDMGQSSHVQLIGVDQFPVPQQVDVEREIRNILQGVSVIEIDSPLTPYINDVTYLEELSRLEQIQREREERAGGYRVEISGDYGPNLMAEVLRYALVAGAIAKRVPHDIIHAHDWLTMLAGVEAKRASGKPLVMHAHALEFDRSGENVNQSVYDIERFGMEQADAVAAVSHYTRDIILKRYGIRPEKVRVVHNAVTRSAGQDTAPSREPHKEKIVLFLGRITFQKGPDYFVEAAAKVLRNRPHVRFVMAGSGDMAPRMIERVAELRIGRRFHFTGFLTGATLERMYRESDIYVMPSVSEPFGISPLEAMRHDVPVIISRQSGVSEVLTHALKVDFWDVDEMANKIIALVDHESLCRELKEQGARELETIQWDTAATRLTELYELLVARAAK